MQGHMFLCLSPDLAYWSQDKHRSVPNYELFEWKWQFGLLCNFGRIVLRSVFYRGLFQDFKFTVIISWLLQGARKDIPRRLKTTKYQENFVLLSALDLKDITYNSDSRETLDMVNVKYVLPKVTFMSKTVSTFVQKVGLIWLKGGFFSYLGHKCNCWLKIVNHGDKRDNGVMCTGKEIKSGLK